MADYAASIEEPFLLILDQFRYLPLVDSTLGALLKNPNVHVIITSPVLSNLDEISLDADKELRRGCVLHQLMPIPLLQNLQRIVYSVMKDYNLSPMNEEQNFFENFEELTAGNPALVSFSTSVLKHTMQMHSEEDSSDAEEVAKGGLYRFNEEVVRPTLLAIKKSCGSSTLDQFDQMGMGLEESTVEGTKVSKEVPDNVMYFTKYLLKYLALSPQECLYINAISVLNGSPIHQTVLDTMEAIILSVTGQSCMLQKRLKHYNILVKHPSPVLRMPLDRARSSYSCNYYYMPAVISEIIETMLDKPAKIVSTSLCHYSLLEVSDRLHSDSCRSSSLELKLSELTIDSSDDILAANVVGLRHLLVNYVSGEWSMFGRGVFLSTVQQYVSEKMLVTGDEGISELTDGIV